MTSWNKQCSTNQYTIEPLRKIYKTHFTPFNSVQIIITDKLILRDNLK